MTAPPGTVANLRSGGSTAPTKNQLIALSTLVLDNCGIRFGRRRVFRLVDQFKERAPLADGFMYFQFLTNAVQMSEAQKAAALRNSDIARCIAYADPTGETAVNNVIRGVRNG
ncbi:Uncharacterised protein [Mycobacteroides abscessus subsp. abscessus]|uniref:hypothetical protein n=1 Tax=Mycobacteroides abscessus TaxID=36809 RepID=UPI00092744B0|nr:hypothetical protein [Mycobacteroides abscessus]MDO3096802.1 hypothetical protein [Mycobacteroides abscessus subsp. abscessus]SHU20679.1 Uncharacterised protein [Mycobacteroides abscessus subsp. abscessus]SHU81645.1 Uncharacterised protein [Mycobacteroides abscessus subsp. abscessus]